MKRGECWNSTKLTEQQYLTDIKNKLFLCVVDFLNLHSLKYILQEMLTYHIGTVNNFHWGIKPV